MEGKIPILLVDDNKGDARLTTHWLKRSQYAGRVHVIPDGAQALAYLRDCGRPSADDSPRLVLLDLHLPDTSGFDVLAAIKADPIWAQLPVIVLSGSNFAEDQDRAAALQAGLFLTKPANAEEFSRLIEVLDDFCRKQSGI
jgi:CheY-like chemotaxis protein